MPDTLFEVAKVLTAIGGISAAAIFVYNRCESILVWLLQKMYGHSGALRISKSSTTGFYFLHANERVQLTCKWHAASLLDRPIDIVAVHMVKPTKDKDGILFQEDELAKPDYVSRGMIHVPPNSTATFLVHFQGPTSSIYQNKDDVEAEIVFTDSFNNPHRKKVRFIHKAR